jgi:hypothetical protein
VPLFLAERSTRKLGAPKGAAVRDVQKVDICIKIKALIELRFLMQISDA